MYRSELDPTANIELQPGHNLTEKFHEVIIDVMTDVQPEHPELIALAEFGSTSRAEAIVKEDGTHSDIDSVLVIDIDARPELRSSFSIGDFIAEHKAPKILDTMPGMELKVWFTKLLEEKGNLKSIPDVRLIVVSEELTYSFPRLLLENATEPIEKVEGSVSFNEDAQRLLRYYASHEVMYALFHKEVYGDLSIYRQKALSVLLEARKEKPQITERAWFIIKTMVEHFEKGVNNSSPPRILPNTLLEAAELYL